MTLKLRPTQQYLKERLRYDPETGKFIYIKKIMFVKIGDEAGSLNTNGHVQIMIDEKPYMAHNLAWLYMTGEWPENFIIDHIDRNYSNNRWLNFRKASLSQNQGNSKIRKDNNSGLKGVYFRRRDGVYVAQITINGKRTYLGQHKEIQKAYELYLIAAKKHFGNFLNVD